MDKLINLNLTVTEEEEATSLNFRYAFKDKDGKENFLMRSYPVCEATEENFLENLNEVIKDFILSKTV